MTNKQTKNEERLIRVTIDTSDSWLHFSLLHHHYQKLTTRSFMDARFCSYNQNTTATFPVCVYVFQPGPPFLQFVYLRNYIIHSYTYIINKNAF